MINERNIFEVCTRVRFRFPFKGLISVEDAWMLSVKDLDSIFKTLNAEVKQVKEESLLNVKTQQNEELDMKIEIIKHIVQVKLTEESVRLKAKEVKEQKQKIMEILASKQDEGLQNKSIEELENILKELK